MFGGGGFGSPQPTFGSAGFGSATTAGGSVFGQQAQPQQTTSLFGGTSTAFGGQQTGLPTFGAGVGVGAGVTQAGAFGSPSSTQSMFGQQARPAASGIFSSPGSNISPFAAQTQQNGTSIPFSAITGTDTMMKNGAASQINTRHQCITCMKEYENKSLEELRFEDYQLNRKGPQNPMFGGVTAGQPQVQQSTGLFSGIGGAAGNVAPGTSTFGQTTAFGQTTNTGGGGLFGTLNKPQAGGFFGAGATPSTSTAFGGGSTLGFSFSNPTSQPQTSIFGANNNPATSNAGLGAQSAFSFATQQPQQQQQQGLGLFGQKSLTTPASTAPTFGGGTFGTTPVNSALNKPLFGGGTAAPTFGASSTAQSFGTGTGSLFSTNPQQQQQNKPFSFNTPFSSAPQPASQQTFGTTNTSTFSFSNPAASAPPLSFGGAAPTFGNTTATGANSSFGAPLSFSLGNTTQPQQPGAAGTSFGQGFFSNNVNTPGVGTTGTGAGTSLFGAGGGTSSFGGGFGSSLMAGQQQSFQMQQQQQQQQQMQQQQLASGMVSFATTPYKDNQLFYNLLTNRKIEDMAKPTNPLAQRQFREASRRKTSTSISGLGHNNQVSQVSIGLTPAVKNLTFSANSKTNSLTKFHVFDGFQDEDLGVGIDVLSPKSSVKRLVLKNSDSNFLMPVSSSSSTSVTEGGSFGLARRASLLSASAMSPSVSRGSFQSPLSQQRRVRITSLNNLDAGNGALEAGRGNGEPIIRKLDFGDSILSTDSNASMLGDSLNHGGEGDSPEIVELYTNPHALSRDSEVEIGSMLNGNSHGRNGNSHGSGPLSGSTAGSVCGVICSRPGYYIKPSLEQLDKKMDANGNCIVIGLEVGRLNFGRLKYSDPVNVAHINFDEIVFFRHREVVVYPDDENKPELGKGINVPAEIELERVFPVDRQTNELIRSPDRIKSLNYEQKLRKTCERLGADFISYDEVHGVWRFKVGHFSKYGLEIDEEDEEEDPNGAAKQTQRGLGGMPPQKMTMQQQQRASLSVAGLGGRPGPSGDAPMLMPGRMSIPPYMHTPNQLYSEATASNIAPTSDVELNPLTPCDSDDDEDDDLDDDDGDEDLEENLVIGRSTVRLSEIPPPSQLQSPAPPTPKYKPILKDSGGEKTQMMKSVMSIEEFNDEDHVTATTVSVMDSQPPIKKSRPSKSVTIVSEFNFEDGHRLKERLSAAKKPTPPAPTRPPPPAIIPEEPVEFSKVPIDNLFNSLSGKRKPCATRLSGAPRVCFLPNGHFLTVSQGGTDNGFTGKVKVEQMVSYADKQAIAPLSHGIRSVLEKQMEARLKNPDVLFLKHIELLEREINDYCVPQVKSVLQEELVIWELCDILWPGEEYLTEETLQDDGFLLEQRRRLSKWLRNHAKILFGDEYDPKDASVLGLLKKGLVDEACLTAIDEGSDWLGVLLSTDPHLLLDFSEDMGVLTRMGKDTPDIFALLSGQIKKISSLTKQKVSTMSTNAWLQYFALFLWFEGPVRCQLPICVEKALKEYDEMMREVAEDEDCALPITETSSIANLAMHLLKMYGCTGYPIKVLVSPRTWGTDCLDYKLAWLLMQDLENIGYLPEDDCYKGVCLGFTGMLEGIGMWKWGYFVLGHLPGPDVEADDGEQMIQERTAREVFCQRLLERNLKGRSQEDEKFLVYQLQVPEHLIYSVKIWRNNYFGNKRYDEEMWYLGNKGEWQDAFYIFMKFLETDLPLDLIGDRVPAQSRSMRIHLGKLATHKERIVGWDVHGKMLSNYLALKDPEGIESAVVNFLESVIKFTPTNSNQCAFLLDMALSAQKVIQLLLAEAVVSPELKKRILDNLLLFLENSAPKEYFEGLRSFINFGLDTQKLQLQNPFPLFGYPPDEQRRLVEPFHLAAIYQLD